MGYIDLSAPVAMIVSGGLYYLFTRRGYTFGDTR
jgi:NCS1 family nucleobase:cation symporter-1